MIRIHQSLFSPHPGAEASASAGRAAPAEGLTTQCLASRDRQETYCIIQALDKADRGDVENGLIFAGGMLGVPKKLCL